MVLLNFIFTYCLSQTFLFTMVSSSSLAAKAQPQLPVRRNSNPTEYTVTYRYAPVIEEPSKRSSIIYPEYRRSGIGGHTNLNTQSGIGGHIKERIEMGMGKACMSPLPYRNTSEASAPGSENIPLKKAISVSSLRLLTRSHPHPQRTEKPVSEH
ncbi:hypothetical protein BX661DRAFT_177835 [Kickxella alabastrina]|uniref:uncharacterized protein n=1 Tax=Kickxella alabastrina TaxID=61397 RepID=UPI00221F3391|nr:uncharacterized protein BX661DRAFT_177835 [Kickxella alabastrina]KAI7833934.1 hypothetical protein BX661DRAFT_177835 [Kickxella alabastrina]